MVARQVPAAQAQVLQPRPHGYEWNKYNQTHYDHDNPPPKMVQGYKFNIFYPDLIDRQRAPAYQLLPDQSGAKDTCVIRFRGGPPCEDLAFKIVNREWEHSHKKDSSAGSSAGSSSCTSTSSASAIAGSWLGASAAK